MASADVIDCYANAEALKGSNGLPGFREVLDGVALGDFQHNLREFYRRARKDAAYILDGRRLAEQLAGEIEWNSQVWSAPKRRA